MMKQPTHSHTHPDEKSGRICLLPTYRKKIVANLKDKMIENKECQCLTKAIRNAGKVLYMNIIAINKISGKLKVWSFKIPHYA